MAAGWALPDQRILVKIWDDAFSGAGTCSCARQNVRICAGRIQLSGREPRRRRRPRRRHRAPSFPSCSHARDRRVNCALLEVQPYSTYWSTAAARVQGRGGRVPSPRSLGRPARASLQVFKMFGCRGRQPLALFCVLMTGALQWHSSAASSIDPRFAINITARATVRRRPRALRC